MGFLLLPFSHFTAQSCGGVVFGLLLISSRNIVVTPGRAFRISGLILLVLLCPLFGVVGPGVGELIRPKAFTLLEFAGEAAEVSVALATRGCGAGSA
jgi:hypothetical protein